MDICWNNWVETFFRNRGRIISIMFSSYLKTESCLHAPSQTLCKVKQFYYTVSIFTDVVKILPCNKFAKSLNG